MSDVTITRAGMEPPYEAKGHTGVAAVRLQGHEAGASTRFWVGRSTYAPGAFADASPTKEETMYLVLDGELQLTVGGEVHHLGTGDSVRLPAATVRRLDNTGDRIASLLVMVAIPISD